jgi:hypothetical protein
MRDALEAVRVADARVRRLRDLVRPVHVETFPLAAGEFRWRDSEFHTGVSARIVSARLTVVERCGKGDRLCVDHGAARYGMTDVTLDGAVVGRVGDDTYRNQCVYVQFGSDPLDVVECDDIWTALVALAFEYLV